MRIFLIISLMLFVGIYLLINKNTTNEKIIVDKYPWQIIIAPDGKTRVFGITLDSSNLSEVNNLLGRTPEIALFEADKKLALEAYYKNVSLGGLIGSFIFTLNATEKQLAGIKRESENKKAAENKGWKYQLNKVALEKIKLFTIKNLIYVPVVQLDEATIINRFGKPKYKIKLKTKEIGWHYLYPDKGLDLIYKKEGKEVLQYVLPENFNFLLQPLQAH